MFTSYWVPIYTSGWRAAMWIKCLAEGQKYPALTGIEPATLWSRDKGSIQYTIMAPPQLFAVTIPSIREFLESSSSLSCILYPSIFPLLWYTSIIDFISNFFFLTTTCILLYSGQNSHYNSSTGYNTTLVITRYIFLAPPQLLLLFHLVPFLCPDIPHLVILYPSLQGPLL